MPADPTSTPDNSSISYISIVDTNSTYQLTGDDDGNFYLDNVGFNSNLYVLHNSVTASDDSDRLFHFYDDTMTKYGVSRFRLSTEDAIPKTAQVASLAALDYDNSDSTKPVMVVADLKGNFYLHGRLHDFRAVLKGVFGKRNRQGIGDTQGSETDVRVGRLVIVAIFR